MPEVSAAAPLGEVFWKQLLGYIEEGLVIPVVGEELLHLRLDGREVSLYTLLAERLAPALGLPAVGLPATGALHEVACRYLDAGGDLEGIYPILKEVMPGRTEIPLPEPLVQLAAIQPFRLFVTTTFDPLLGWAIDKERFGNQEGRTRSFAYSPEHPQDLPCKVEDLVEPVVYHLFGQLSAAPVYAVTEADTLEFLQALQAENRRPPNLFDALNEKHLLFLGESFPDWPARFFLRLAKRERFKAARSHVDVVADTRVHGDPGLVLFLQRFSFCTKVFQGGGAAEFVAELSRRWKARIADGHGGNGKRPGTGENGSVPPHHPVGMTDGAIFLSYASEDRDAARAFKEELDKAGLDTWMDIRELQPGSSWEEEIYSAIGRCSVFVPLLSKQVETSKRRFFRAEWDHARKLANRALPDTPFIVPVALDEISPESPAVPECFRQRNWARVSDGRIPQDLVDTLKRLYRSYQKNVKAAP